MQAAERRPARLADGASGLDGHEARLLRPPALGRQGVGARSSRWDRRRWRGYAGLCGWSLARAHARTGDRLAIAAYLGKSDAFDQAIAEFAEAYADQNEADYRALLDAQRDGRLTVESGV